MRLEKPRIAPLDPEDLDAETKERFGGRALNIFRTLAHHPKLLKRWLVFGNHILSKSTLSEREREIVAGMNILFIGDIFGRPGRKLLANHLADLVSRLDKRLGEGER